jgi:hypothetical protein
MGLKVETSTKWVRFGSVGGEGAAVNLKAVNRVDAVEVRVV